MQQVQKTFHRTILGSTIPYTSNTPHTWNKIIQGKLAHRPCNVRSSSLSTQLLSTRHSCRVGRARNGLRPCVPQPNLIDFAWFCYVEIEIQVQFLVAMISLLRDPFRVVEGCQLCSAALSWPRPVHQLHSQESQVDRGHHKQPPQHLRRLICTSHTHHHLPRSNYIMMFYEYMQWSNSDMQHYAAAVI